MNSNSARQIVEQFHLLFLNQLGQKLDKRLYALKGGCNLRFYFNSIRYSEDIDLDVQTIATQTLQQKVDKIITADAFNRILATKGIILRSYSTPKQTSTTQRWKVELAIPNSALTINTRIEFSRREKIQGSLLEPIQPEIIQMYRLPPILTSHYTIIPAFQQKIFALAKRNEVQARDIFDLYLLLNNKGLDINSMTEQTKKISLQAKEQAGALTFNDFKSKVLAYLPLEYQKQYNDQHVWKTMVAKVCEILEELGNAAQ